MRRQKFSRTNKLVEGCQDCRLNWQKLMEALPLDYMYFKKMCYETDVHKGEPRVLQSN